MPTGLGIDLGSESIKLVQVQISGQTVIVTGAFKLPRGGKPVLDAPAAQTLDPFLPEEFGPELKRVGLSRRGTVGVTGREVTLKYLLTPPMPPDKMKQYLDLEIGEKLAATPGAAEPGVTYDYRALNIAGGTRGDLVIMAGACKNEYLYALNAVLKTNKVTARQITPSCFGLVNTYLRTQKVKPEETVVLLEIGHELLEVAILEGENLLFARSTPGGSKRFTAALDKILKLGDVKAQEFKHSRVRLYPEGAPLPNQQELAFQNALKEGADNIAGAVRSAVMFCRTQARLPKLDYQRVVLSGGGARLAGLREYIEKKLSRPVQVLDLYAGLDLRKLDAASARCFEGEITDMAVPLGLAIIDADARAPRFSLLPAPVVRRRAFWQKTVFAIAGGVALLALLVPPIQYSGKARDDAEDRKKDFQSKSEAAGNERKQFTKKTEALRQQSKQNDYYVRYLRMGRVYVELFRCIRAETPKSVTLNYVGPSGETAGLLNRTGLNLGTWNAVDEPVREFVIRGAYDTDEYPGTKFNDALNALCEKLLAIPGVKTAELDLSPESDQTARQGTKLFQVNVTLQDQSQPLKPGKAPARPASLEKAAAPEKRT